MKTVDFDDIFTRVPLNATAQRVVRNCAESRAWELFHDYNYQLEMIKSVLVGNKLSKSERFKFEAERQSVLRKRKKLIQENECLWEYKSVCDRIMGAKNELA